ERSLERMGSNESIPLDIRVVAATKTDLLRASEEGDFREDLYYRLNVVYLEIPPLRQRREDIPLLFHHFLLVAGHRYQQESPLPTAQQMNSLMSYRWPGNVRELRNLAERYVLLGSQCNWSLDRLLLGGEDQVKSNLPQQVESFERSLIEQALAASNGSIKDVMDTLAIPRKTLYDKMLKGLDCLHILKEKWKVKYLQFLGVALKF
ncbi:unnamed protein product, partial [Cyprideis torosa]